MAKLTKCDRLRNMRKAIRANGKMKASSKVKANATISRKMKSLRCPK